MGAPEIVERAREAGLDIIGIADHNTCENYPGIAGAAQNGARPGVPFVLPCIEAQSRGRHPHSVRLPGIPARA